MATNSTATTEGPSSSPVLPHLLSAILGLPVLGLYLTCIAALISTRIIPPQFRLFLLNISMAQILHWVSVILLFIWYPGVVTDESEVTSAIDSENVCSKLLPFFEVTALQVFATIGLYCITLYVSFKFVATDLTMYIMLCLNLTWGAFMLTGILLAENNFGELGEDGFCSVNLETPNFWLCQGAFIVQLAGWLFVILLFNFLVVKLVKKNGLDEAKALVKIMICHSLVGFSVVIINLTPHFSPFLGANHYHDDIDILTEDIDATTLVLINQVLPILAMLPTLITPLFILSTLKCFGVGRRLKKLHWVKLLF